MPRSRGFTRAVRGPRRQTAWVAGPDEVSPTTVVAGAADLQSSSNAALLAMRPFTVVRTVGLLFVGSDQIAANEVFFGAFGLAVVSDQASAIGVTAVPTPITDEGSDLWFTFQYGAGEWRFNTSGSPSAMVFPFDSRAMRKVEDGQDVVSVFENATSGPAIRYLARFRFLIKVH